MTTEAELRRRGRMGFSEEDYAEWLRRKIARREDVQAHEMELGRLREFGAGRRLGREHEFRRPEQAARIGEIGARTAAEEYALGKRRELAPFAERELGRAEKLGGLDVKYLTESVKRFMEEGKVPEKGVPGVARPEPVTPAGVARPGRKLRPSVEKFLWSGYPKRGLPGLGAPLKGWMDIGEILRRGMGKAGRWLFPEAR